MITRLAHIGRWLVPALLGPLLAIWVFVTLSVLFGHWDPKLGRWGTWVLSMIFGTLVGGGLGLSLIVVDALLLRFRRRLLPMGARAWLMALGAPLCLFAIWTLWPPGRVDGARFVLRLLLPLPSVALALRLAFAPRFHR